jgi:hypothetical protein
LSTFDPAALLDSAGPRSRDEFREWHRQQSHPIGDPAPLLRAWLFDMLQKFPEGDPYGAPGGTDYRIGPSVIYADIPWHRREPAYETAFSLAARHRLGLFNAGLWAQEVWLPDEGERLALSHRATLDPERVPYWAVGLIPYAERWKIDDQLEFDRSLDGKLARLRAFEDAINVGRRAPKVIDLIVSVRH